MDGPFIKAQRYHERAQNLRKLAQAEDDARQRESLMEIADRYDKLSGKLIEAGVAARKGQS